MDDFLLNQPNFLKFLAPATPKMGQFSQFFEFFGAKKLVTLGQNWPPFWPLAPSNSSPDTKLFILGLKNLDSRLSAKSGCEFCYMSIVKVTQSFLPRDPNLIPARSNGVVMDAYNFETVCLYKPNVGSRCPNVVKNAKTMFRNLAMKNGQKLTQYLNTPTCDSSNDFATRFI